MNQQFLAGVLVVSLELLQHPIDPRQEIKANMFKPWCLLLFCILSSWMTERWREHHPELLDFRCPWWRRTRRGQDTSPGLNESLDEYLYRWWKRDVTVGLKEEVAPFFGLLHVEEITNTDCDLGLVTGVNVLFESKKVEIVQYFKIHLHVRFSEKQKGN